MAADWFLTTLGPIGMVVLSTLAIYVSVIVLHRIAGLRSFATISSFDFVMTIAIGSLVASTAINRNPPLLQALAGLIGLFALQVGVALLRRWSPRFKRTVDNEPMLLMAGPEIIRANLKRVRLTQGELLSKLREANVLDVSQVRAVVMETTGTISVLHGPPDGKPLDPWLLEDVRDAGKLAGGHQS